MSQETPKPRQTQSFLRSLFRERNLQPKNKLGQNFLVDLNLLDFIVREGDVGEKDLVLEVGAGTGSLTSRLCDRAGGVLSVEIDPAFHELVRETIGFRKNLFLFHGDILHNKNTLSPEVLTKLHDGLERFKPDRLKLVANLPYAVATPVISNLLLTDLPIERMVVTVQWEIAERLTAMPGSSAYGSLAVLVQSLADVEILRKLPPAVFWPRPQVDSAVVRIVPSATKQAGLDRLAFRTFLRDLYTHRRKNLRGALQSMPGTEREKADIDRDLESLGIAGTLRAEDLTLEQHRALFERFK